MINLIPHKGQVALKHEYTLRVASVYGFMLGGVFLASTALLVPTYVLTSTQLSVAQDESSNIEETRAAFDSAFGEIKVANTVMAQLRKEQDAIAISTVIEEIVKSAPHEVTFTTFQTTREGVRLKEIRVQGIAKNRIALSTFKNAIEASPLFLQALVPIADLARDTDLPFVITITLEGNTGEASVTKTP
jgi:Tfp pilus assembly protein PilN